MYSPISTPAPFHLRKPPIHFLAMLFFLAVALPASLPAQELTHIVMVGGEEYWGTIMSETSDTIALQSTSGVGVHIPRSSIRSIVYNAENPEDPNHGYWAFGGTLGTPAALNLVLARNFNRNWGIRFSGMFYGKIRGLQIDGMRRIGGSGSFSHNVHVGLGSSQLGVDTYTSTGYYRESTWNYVTGGYDLNWGGFQFAVGLSVGSGTFTNPQLLLQIGYVHQFK